MAWDRRTMEFYPSDEWKRMTEDERQLNLEEAIFDLCVATHSALVDTETQQKCLISVWTRFENLRPALYRKACQISWTEVPIDDDEFDALRLKRG